MKIHHVGYLTKSIVSAQKEFLRMGFAEEKKMAFDPYRGIDILFMRSGDYRVELIEPKDENSPLYPLLKRYKNTPYHFCFVSDGLQNDIARLQEEGYLLMQEPMTAPCLGDAKAAFLMHPDLGIVELAEFEKTKERRGAT